MQRGKQISSQLFLKKSCSSRNWPLHRKSENALSRLDHLHNRQRLAIVQRNSDALDFDVAFEAIKRYAGERRAHLKFVEACCLRGCFDVGQDERAETAPGKAGMHEDGADLGGVDCRVEKLRLANRRSIAAEK